MIPVHLFWQFLKVVCNIKFPVCHLYDGSLQILILRTSKKIIVLGINYPSQTKIKLFFVWNCLHWVTLTENMMKKKFGKTNWICQDSRLKTYHLKPIVSIFFFSLYMSLKNNVFWCQILKKFMLIKADYVCTIWHTFLIKNCCMGILFSILYLCCKLSDIYMFKLICFITVGGIWHLPSLVNLVALVQQWQFYLQWFM